MRRNIYILVLFFISVFSNAQNPSLVWAKRLGGPFEAYGQSSAVDVFGNVYTTGFYSGTVDFDPGVGTYNLSSAGSYDIFISKIDASGLFVWAKSIGGSGNDRSNALAIDSAGSVYTTGWFEVTADFDPSVGVYNLTTVAGFDIFVSKLDSSGAFVWAKSMGGAAVADYGQSIFVDKIGCVYITGGFAGSADFDPGIGVFNITSKASSNDIFISKLDASGNFVWAKSMGGAGSDYGLSIVVDAAYKVYTTGYFENTADFDPGPSWCNFTSVGYQDIFISKLDPNGAFVWAKNIGSVNYEAGNSIAVDIAGNVYTTGFFNDVADFDPGVGTYSIAPTSGSDIFISKLDASGSFVWAKNFGGNGGGNSIKVDAMSNVYTTGSFLSTADFDPGAGIYNLTSTGGSKNIFASKLDASGSFIWAAGIGGTSFNFGNSIFVDAVNNIYIIGSFQGISDFDPGPSVYNLVASGYEDVCIIKLNDAIESVEEKYVFINTKISPNPNNGTFKIQIDNEIQEGEIILFNSLGQKIHEQKISQGENNIETNNLSKGLYHYIITQNKLQLSNGKLAIE